MTKLLNHPQVKPLLSDEHFSVDGTLIEAWASQKSFKPKDGPGDGDGTNWHKQKRANETHASTTDPESRLYRKADGREAKLCYLGHVAMENRHGLAVAGMVTTADGRAERSAAQAMLKAKRRAIGHRITAGADKAYDTSDHVETLGHRCHTTCGAEPEPDQDRQAAKKRDRWPHHTPCRLWPVAEAPQDDRMHLRLGQAARPDAQDQAPQRRPCWRRIPAEPPITLSASRN